MEVLGRKGKPLVVHEGYRYRLNKTNISSRNWRCTTPKCKGNLTTPSESILPALAKGVHSHPPDPGQNEIYDTRAKIAIVAREQPELAPRAIISRVVGEASIEAQARMPNHDVLKRDIQRKRTRQAAFPRVPRTSSALLIPDEYKKTRSGRRFLLYDSKDDDQVNNSDQNEDEEEDEEQGV